MRSVNKVILIGNLTRDPQMKSTQNGQAITTFGIATNRQWKTSAGDHKQSTQYHDLVAWGRLAEICSTYLKKGKLIYVEGYLKTRSWETETGEKKYRTEVVVMDMIMLEKRSSSDEMTDYIPEDENMEEMPTELDDTGASTDVDSSEPKEGENVF